MTSVLDEAASRPFRTYGAHLEQTLNEGKKEKGNVKDKNQERAIEGGKRRIKQKAPSRRPLI